MSKIIIPRGRMQLSSGIIAEFWIPQKITGRALIICDGAPSVPSKAKLAEFFTRKGYWVFHMRYLGTWESSGEFLKHSPSKDVDELISAINAGFRDVYTGMTYFLDIREITVVGASFGGTAAILATLNSKVVNAIAISPVIDWNAQAKYESIDMFINEISGGFPGAYRCPKKNYKKLLTKKFYNPIDFVEVIDGEKLLLIHARDDKTVPYMPTKKFAKITGAAYLEYPEGGHLGSSIIMEREMWKKVQLFLFEEIFSYGK